MAPNPKLVNDFARVLRRLVTAAAKHFPEDDTMATIKRRVHLALSASPVQAMQQVGEELYERRELLLLDDEELLAHLLAIDYAAEIKQLDPAAMGLIPQAKKLLADMPRQKQEFYLDSLRDLLDYYMEYLEAN